MTNYDNQTARKTVNGIIPRVFIVDDDREIRAALSCLLTAAGYQVCSFESAERFIEAQDAEAPGCLLLDVCLPGLSGSSYNGRLQVLRVRAQSSL